MSKFSNFEGVIRFKNTFDYNEALTLGTSRGNFKPFEPDYEGLTLSFPEIISGNDGSKNLFHLVGDLSNIGFKGKLVGICTDGMSEGYIVENGEMTTVVDLIEWAIKNIPKYFGKSPEEINSMEDSDDDDVLDEYYIMLDEIASAFIDMNK